MFGIEALSQFQEVGLTLGSGDNQLRLGGVKIIVSETTGQLQPPQPELNQQVFNAHRTGFQLAIHAMELRAVKAAIIALEYAHSHLPQAGRRPHKTLANPYPRTPTMAAGISNHIWTIEEVVKLAQ